MKHLRKLLMAGAVLVAAAMPLHSANAYWGGPVAPGGQALSEIPGWSPQEVAEKYDFYGPYGPSITDVRRFHRDLWWGRPMDDLVFPMGPSPTDIRRQQRREWYRSMGVPY